jgi:periplasmic protein TonB
MESNKILQADLLDILFEGKNKEYGAYELRKTYNGRMVRALTVTGGVIVLLFTASFVSGRGPKKTPIYVDTTTVVLSAVDRTELPPPPPPKPRVEVQQVATRIFTPPKIVAEDVKPDEKPPVVDDLENVKIGTVNKGGVADGVVGPPAPIGDGNKGIVEKPKEDDDGPVMIVQIESMYPGGIPAWQRYMNKNFVYPEDAQSTGTEGQVVVRFIVDRDGSVSDVEAISGPTTGGLREEAVRVIRKSGKWVPAVQNGRNVKSYKQQPVTFKLSD